MALTQLQASLGGKATKACRPYKWLRTSSPSDNDNDGRTDKRENSSGDPGCSSPGDGSERCAPGTGCPACDDGITNDFDELIDYSNSGTSVDPGCFGPDDTTETNPERTCDDGLDNDADMKTDVVDTEDCPSPEAEPGELGISTGGGGGVPGGP